MDNNFADKIFIDFLKFIKRNFKIIFKTLKTISLKELNNVRGPGDQILNLNIEITRDTAIRELSAINKSIIELNKLANNPKKLI